MKKLSKEGRFECGLDEIVAGKVWAFVGVMSPGPLDGFGLGIAIANEAGYYPIPFSWSHFDTFDEASQHAEELNAAEGLSLDQAAKIVFSSMRGGLK